MKAFPMFIRTTGRRVVIAGGGEQAAQKTRLMLKTDAQIVVAADALDDELRGLAEAGRIDHRTGPVTAGTFQGAAMAFVATGCPGTDACLHALAEAACVPINVVDQPDLCTVTTPSIVDRDPVVVAIGTEGTAPVLARAIKTEVETLLSPGLGGLAALAGSLRGAVARRIPRTERRAFWGWVFKGAPAQHHRQGQEREAARLIKTALDRGRAPDRGTGGHIALVGAGPGARDLLTLRAVERLQEADVIYYDRLVDAQVLELARRDAERVFVGKLVGASAWPQHKICELIVAQARKGRRVVRLKSGDPSVFGRATEEIEAARAAGLPVEIVPGVTAACAAAAALSESLTCRGVCDTLVLSTGTCRPGDAPPDWASQIRPGTTLVLYMAVGSADRIAQALRRAGLDERFAIDVCANVSRADQRLLRTTVAGLTECLRDQGITGSTVLKLTVPKGFVPTCRTRPEPATAATRACPSGGPSPASEPSIAAS